MSTEFDMMANMYAALDKAMPMEKRDIHDLHWYWHEVQRFADIVGSHFGVELNDIEEKGLRDSMYRAVSSAKAREALKP